MSEKSDFEETEFDQILNKEIYYFLDLKRLYQVQTKLLLRCNGYLIKNDLIYHQLLFGSLDGLFVRLDNYHVRLQSVLNILKSKHLDRFKRNNKRGLAVDPKTVEFSNECDDKVAEDVARHFTKKLEQGFDGVYDRLFPNVKVRGEGRPNYADFDLVIEELRNVFAPIRSHRDTVVAHWDKDQQPATLSELKKAIEYLEYLLGGLYSISKLGVYSFELGGMAASVDGTANELAELILGSYRVRPARVADMREIYLMGYDAWGNNMKEEEYINDCESSGKYARGKWFVLEERDGKPVSSLIVYEFPQSKDKPAIGLGSIASTPIFRRKGFAGRLIWDVMRLYGDASRIFYLYSDIEPKYYKNFGFERLPEKYQKHQGSILMIRCSKEKVESLINDPSFTPPSYF